MRRIALSSRVRSNHWLACVLAALGGRLIIYLLSEQHLSLRMGLRLYAMALLPIWFFANGSSTSLRFASGRMSPHIVCALCDAAQQGQYVVIYFARVGLTAHGNALAEAHFRANHFV